MQMPCFGKTNSFMSVPPVSNAKTGKSSGKSCNEHLFQPRVSIHPIPERIARGCSGSIQLGEIKTFSAPIASAVLN